MKPPEPQTGSTRFYVSLMFEAGARTLLESPEWRNDLASAIEKSSEFMTSMIPENESWQRLQASHRDVHAYAWKVVPAADSGQDSDEVFRYNSSLFLDVTQAALQDRTARQALADSLRSFAGSLAEFVNEILPEFPFGEGRLPIPRLKVVAPDLDELHS